MGRLKRVADRYEEMVNDGTIKWEPVIRETLDASTIRYITIILDPTGLKYQIAQQRLEGTVLFKIDHPTICYLHHDPITQQHMWADKGFHEAICNDMVLVEFAKMLGCKLPREVMMRIISW